jgi:hypothetical protein
VVPLKLSTTLSTGCDARGSPWEGLSIACGGGTEREFGGQRGAQRPFSGNVSVRCCRVPSCARVVVGADPTGSSSSRRCLALCVAAQ